LIHSHSRFFRAEAGRASTQCLWLWINVPMRLGSPYYSCPAPNSGQ